MKQLLQSLHTLFDPEVNRKHSERFTLKYPTQGEQDRPDLFVQTQVQAPPDLSTAVDLNLAHLREGLHADATSDLIIREFALPFNPPVRCCLLYLNGLVDGDQVNRALLGPLMDLPGEQPALQGPELLQHVQSLLLPSRDVRAVYTLGEALGAIPAGVCALIIDSVAAVLLIDLRQIPGRGVEATRTEAVLRGPHEAFTENLRTNTGLIRHRLKSPDLIFEGAQLGRRSRTPVTLGYLHGLVNPELLGEIRRRLSSLDIDALNDTGELEQYLEDSPLSLFPTIGGTERPDRAAANIAEGRVVMLVDGSPYALIVPWVFGDFFRNPEDYYIKWPFGTFLRIMRLAGLFVTLLLPALYIAIANFHQEMIPTPLLLAIAASREAVPFPVPLEVLIMEIAFEIIREGSIRIPALLGQTVGIVGALILGEAAVAASIVSPILVIIVAVTALGSFTIPNYGVSLAVRVLRFGFILLGASFGLFGIALGLLLVSAHTTALRSFGVPYMAPVGPRLPSSPDLMVRGPIIGLDKRPAMLHARDTERQAEIVTDWKPAGSNKGEGSE